MSLVTSKKLTAYKNSYLYKLLRSYRANSDHFHYVLTHYVPKSEENTDAQSAISKLQMSKEKIRNHDTSLSPKQKKNNLAKRVGIPKIGDLILKHPELKTNKSYQLQVILRHFHQFPSTLLIQKHLIPKVHESITTLWSQRRLLPSHDQLINRLL